MEGEVEVEEEEGERKKSLRLIFTKILPDRDNHLHLKQGIEACRGGRGGGREKGSGGREGKEEGKR